MNSNNARVSYKVVGIVEGKKRYYFSATYARARDKMCQLLQLNIPAWIEERTIQDELSDMPYV